ncbi:MAG: molybdopterin-dependent oxidoreductase [Myxococcota bacterium]|jgi:anaerobic selenocysteine-containing dehydrogenase|nr:molybdopterin-dependent oxidoreductase [Myxococcota bacterium]
MSPETKTRRTFCRLCAASCGLSIDVEDNRIVAVSGDREHAMSRGYTCVKGRNIAAQWNHPERLRTSLRRGEGGFEAIGSAAALDEVAARLSAIRDAHGPHAIASFCGTAAYFSAPAVPVSRAWHAGLGSRSRYSTMTIDQASKIIAVMNSGTWGGGPHSFASADVIMLVGSNPFVSALHQMGGPPGFRPTALREAKDRGLEVIVVDPRRTETARMADLHLPVKPGQDAALIAGMIRLILSEELHDAAFCEEHVDGLDALREAVEPFTPEVVAARAGIESDLLVRATRMFAEGPRGVAGSGTGPDMAPHPHLSEQLLLALNSICGRWSREGEKVGVPSVLTPDLPRPAQVIPKELLPPELNDAANAERSRIRGVRQVFNEMPTAVLPDEILTPGEGQVRALVVVGANPVACWPDQARTIEALSALDLLVCVDVVPSETTQLADYVIAPRHSLERTDLSSYQDMLWEEPFAQFTEPVIEPEGDLVEDWQVFVGLARRMGSPIELAGGVVESEDEDTLSVLEKIYPATKISLRKIAEYEGGHVFEEVAPVVGPPIPGVEGRLRVASEQAIAELGDVAREGEGAGDEFTHLLAVRRLKHVANSVGRDFPKSAEAGRHNAAYLHPDELAALGVRDGDLIEIESADGCIDAVVEADADVRPGVVSMAHGFGRPSASGDVTGDTRKVGSSTARLISSADSLDPLIAMPRFSAIPVRLRASG